MLQDGGESIGGFCFAQDRFTEMIQVDAKPFVRTFCGDFGVMAAKDFVYHGERQCFAGGVVHHPAQFFRFGTFVGTLLGQGRNEQLFCNAGHPITEVRLASDVWRSWLG